ncbi:MAG: YitT family protein [Lachnospiraceae bacterium]|nr:YitT family protein [Lachnospiraceae bacterium]
MLADWEGHKIRNWIALVIGVFLIAASVNWVYDPAGMVTGGVTGIGISVKYLSGKFLPVEIPVWLTNLAFNLPLLILAWKLLGKKFILRTLIATGLLSLFIYLIPYIPVFEEDALLACVFGGVIAGTGMGLVLATMSTTGGTDVLCMLLHVKLKHISVPRLLNIVDGIVVVTGVFVFGINKALYAIISVYIVAKVSDGIMDGMKFAKMAYIISDHYEEISGRILNVIDRGVTGLSATGMYSNKDRKVLFCVVSKKEMVEVLEITHRIDPKAFVIVSDVREVMGEGFIEYKQ